MAAGRVGRTGEGFLDVDIRTEVGVPDGGGDDPELAIFVSPSRIFVGAS